MIKQLVGHSRLEFYFYQLVIVLETARSGQTVHTLSSVMSILYEENNQFRAHDTVIKQSIQLRR